MDGVIGQADALTKNYGKAAARFPDFKSYVWHMNKANLDHQELKVDTKK